MDNTNIFIQKGNSLITSIMMENKKKITSTQKPTKKKFKLFDKPVSEEDDILRQYDIVKSTREYCDTVLYNEDHDLPFNILWDYAEFIRWCEKMFIYENNPDQIVVSDTQLDALDNRVLIINKKGFFIHINLKISQKADFDNKSDKLIFHEIKEINIKRSYGKEMCNKFRVMDNNVKFNDDSDKLLYDLVNEIIYESIRNHFLTVIRNIDNGNFINNMLFNDRFITP